MLITGGTSGLGAAAARSFAAEGFQVVFCGRRIEEGRTIETTIRESGGDALFVQADVTHESQMESLVQRTLDRYGRLDAAFNNAGANLYFGAIEKMSSAQFMDNIQLNLTGVFNAMKYQIQAMQQNGGSIINTASTAGVKGIGQGIAAYVAAKHGVIGLTRAAALEQARNGIRINALVISAMATEQWLEKIDRTPGLYEKIAAGMPMGKVSRVEDILPTVAFLASDGARFITGAAIPVDGGVTAG